MIFSSMTLLFASDVTLPLPIQFSCLRDPPLLYRGTTIRVRVFLNEVLIQTGKDFMYIL